MIAILYPFKMDKNLSEAYSTIYESSVSSGSSGGHYSDGGDGVFRSKDDVARKFNKNFPPKKNGKVDVRTRKAINTSARDFGIQGPTTVKNSYEPEGEIVEGKKPLPKTKMYRKAGNYSREALGKGLDTKEGSKLQDKSSKIVSTISSDDERKRFDKMTTKKSELYNDTTGKFRQEWEALKLIETENHREKFDTWLEGIAEEGYDIDRWTDEELVDTFINENDLWDSRESVETALFESDKKGKGSGKKDACYHKVKASASVWPSAYASGRLVQCRKKGAANYGKSKKEDFSDWRDDLGLITEYTGAIQAAAKPVTKAIVRAGIKVGGKTGGKVAKEVIKGAGTAAKDAAMNAAAKVGAGAVNKVVDTVKPKPKQLPKEVAPANPR